MQFAYPTKLNTSTKNTVARKLLVVLSDLCNAICRVKGTSKYRLPSQDLAHHSQVKVESPVQRDPKKGR